MSSTPPGRAPPTHNNHHPHQHQQQVTLRKPVFTKVEQLKPGTSGHTLVAKVVTSNVVLQKGRAASPHLRQTRIAECLVGDDTGTIVFTARNDQAKWRAMLVKSCASMAAMLRTKLLLVTRTHARCTFSMHLMVRLNGNEIFSSHTR